MDMLWILGPGSALNIHKITGNRAMNAFSEVLVHLMLIYFM